MVINFSEPEPYFYINIFKYILRKKEKTFNFAYKKHQKLLISAAIAQLVEHFIRNEKVVGSSPTRGSVKRGSCVKIIILMQLF